MDLQPPGTDVLVTGAGEELGRALGLGFACATDVTIASHILTAQGDSRVTKHPSTTVSMAGRG